MLGNWSEKRGWNFDSRYANRWEFDIDPDSEDLEGLHLRVVVYLEEPFVIKTGENQYEGFCIDLLNEMTKVLKFNYTIIEVQDGTYGIEDESGRWNGIIGALQRHEADLSLSAVTITYSRAEVVDFTLPFMHLGISILLARTSEETDKGSLWTFLEPLSLTVWISLLISYCIVSYSMHILAKFSPYEWYNLERIDERDFENIKNQKNQFTILNSFWFTMGSLMQQGSDVIPRAAATRLIAVVWWMFTQIIISSYTAQLAAFLTVERMSTPIESTQDLANQQKIRYGVLKSGSTMDFFRESKIPMYERMWSVMESSSPGVFVNSSREGIARVKSGGYAYMMESSMLEYYLERDCDLQSIGGLLDSKGYGIALPKGSPLRDILSRTVLQLQERTILEALKNKWWRDRREGPSCAPPTEKATNSKPQNIFGIFYVLLTGLIVAFLLACGEYCIESRHEAFRLKLTIVGKFIDWYRGNSNDTKVRSKMRNMQLDTAGQEIAMSQLAEERSSRPEPPPQSVATSRPDPTRLSISSPAPTICVVSCDDGTPISRDRPPSISRAGLRRLSRMLPATTHEQLSRFRQGSMHFINVLCIPLRNIQYLCNNANYDTPHIDCAQGSLQTRTMPDGIEPMYIVESSDKQRLRVSHSILKQSVTLCNVVDLTVAHPDSEEDTFIPIDNADRETLENVFKFCERYVGKGEFVEPEDHEAVSKMPKWETDFINSLGSTMLMKVARAVDYLEIKRLSYYITTFLASLITGKTNEQMMKIMFTKVDEKKMAEKAEAKRVEEEERAAKVIEENTKKRTAVEEANFSRSKRCKDRSDEFNSN
ncbi:unnamed protein product [Caenorhabditis brenneri]